MREERNMRRRRGIKVREERNMRRGVRREALEGKEGPKEKGDQHDGEKKVKIREDRDTRRGKGKVKHEKEDIDEMEKNRPE